MSTRRHISTAAFQQDESGGVLILFALMASALFFLAGFAVDYGRIQDVRSRMTDAIDAASLAAGRALLDGKLSDDKIIELAKAYYAHNSKSSSTLISTTEPAVTIDREKGVVDISVRSTVAMTLARIGGYNEVDVPVTSEATFLPRDIEVGVALDITGSMATRINGTRKIDSLKSAFKDFTKELFPVQPVGSQRVRVALAPYASAIKLGSYAKDISGGASNDGCVTESKSGAYSDNVGSYFVKADGVKNIDPAGGYGSEPYSCAKSKPAIMPLSDSKSALDDAVATYEADGSTGGHFGAQWAWNMISDKWAGTFSGDSAPESYDEVKKGKLMKAVVLMTDGEFNTAYHSGTSSAQAVELCDAMKTEGVVVFTVGFGLGGDQNALKTLQNCATSGPGYFASADNEAQLTAVFRQFAAKLNQLRLSK